MKKLDENIPLITEEQIRMVEESMKQTHTEGKGTSLRLPDELLPGAIDGMKAVIHDANKMILFYNARNEILKESNYGTKNNKVGGKN